MGFIQQASLLSHHASKRMKYIHYPVEASEGEVIEVKLDGEANVYLLDPTNFDLYKEGRGFRYRGGYANFNPARLDVPHTGTWHVVIDLGGGPGHVRASLKIMSGSEA